MLEIQNQKLCDARNNSVTQKTSRAKARPPALSNSLTVKAGRTGMQKVLKQNLHKIVIYVNKSRPEKDYWYASKKKTNDIRRIRLYLPYLGETSLQLEKELRNFF